MDFAYSKLLLIGVGGLAVVGGVFALIYWLLSRGKDE